MCPFIQLRRRIFIEHSAIRAALFALDQGAYDLERSLDELAALAQANDMQCVAQLVQRRNTPDAATYFGEGKLAEGRLLCDNLQVDCVIVDAELSASQLRNLEQLLEREVIDRTMLILEIFKNRAVTNEGKLQTELASLRYRLPRLAGLGQSLSRQGGGGGGGTGARRGAGESQLEHDRRHIRRRIEALEQHLEEIKQRRAQTRKHRQKNCIPVIALVGYTNVGKSSLMNYLCDAQVAAKDMLFATLDPTARRLTLPSGLESILIDTVGFVSRLPHGLVRAFQSTLEEAAFADVIIRVCDAADPNAAQQLCITDQVLNELGCAHIPQLTVYHKCDLTACIIPFDCNAISTSTVTGQGIPELLQQIDTVLANRTSKIAALLPYCHLKHAAVLRENGTVFHEEYRSDGLYLEGMVKREALHLLKPFLLSN